MLVPDSPVPRRHGSELAQPESDLDLQENVGIERRGWRVQRAAWLAMLVVVLAALGGLFGNGPLSWSTRTSTDGDLRVTYDRFARLGGNAELGIDLGTSSDESSNVAIEIERSYLEAVVVQSVTPQPDSVESAGEFLRYVFRADSGSPLRVVFEVEPDSAWSASGRVRAGGDDVELDMFVYP